MLEVILAHSIYFYLPIINDDKVRNAEVLRRIGEEKRILKVIENRNRNWLGHCLRRDCLLTTVMEVVIEGDKRRGRRRMKLID